MPLLEVDEVSKAFRGLRAVARASFAVERHTIAFERGWRYLTVA